MIKLIFCQVHLVTKIVIINYSISFQINLKKLLDHSLLLSNLMYLLLLLILVMRTLFRRIKNSMMVYEVVFLCHGFLLCREKTLPILSNVTLIVEVQNFVLQKTAYQILIRTHAGQFPSIFSKVKQQYYPFESLNLTFNFVMKCCIENSKLSNDKSQYQTKFYEVYRNNSKSRPSNINYTDLFNSNQLEYNIQSYSLSAWTAYIIQLYCCQQIFRNDNYYLINLKNKLFKI
ncbi:unnamed protein product [Paramecium octaurelia]|uniref:Transmembrane protein n=1 Tax=Paramecium octaurelia TaxID=43137 RepID=A0A8S1WGV4_PAROT|nr:unnamed protein product [Paramecium octaurelia]